MSHTVKRMALSDDLPCLIALWQKCLEPEEIWPQKFFELFPPAGHCLCYVEDGRPVSMLNLIEAALRVGEKEFPLLYFSEDRLSIILRA